MVGAAGEALWNRQAAPFAVVSYKSHGLKRKCDSTLAAEAHSMSEGLAEAEWVRGMFEEVTNPRFNIINWES